MAVDTHHLSPPLAQFRSWKLGLLVALTLLLAVPLWQLRDHTTAGYYKEYVSEKLSKYLGSDGGVYNNTLYGDGNEAVHPHYNTTDPCADFPDTTGILLVMKTGATEAFDKMPTQLLTTMQCLPDFLIFSDLEQQIGPHHVYNALETVDETTKSPGKKEWELYEAQKNCPVSQKECTDGMSGGWDLDKYKFLHMVQRTWEMRPGMDWYVFGEADTYFVWSNLVQWLRDHQDAADDVYVGSVAMVRDVPFAHGGSGYVVSAALLQKMAEGIPDVANKYDKLAEGECCGDYLMSLAAQEVGTKVKNVHPMFNGEKPNTIPYGPGQWCEPLFTMHHMNPEEISAVWQYQKTRTSRDVIQVKEMYHAFVAPKLTTIRLEWNNLAGDTAFVGPSEDEQHRAGADNRKRQRPEEQKNVVERHAHESPVACSRVCEAAGLDLGIPDAEYDEMDETGRGILIRSKYDERADDVEFKRNRDCFQWRYHKGVCCTAKTFKLGAPKHEGDESKLWTSGWFVDGIRDWVDSRECERVEWKEPR